MPVLKLRQVDVRDLPYVGQSMKHQYIYWDAALPCFGFAGLSERATRICMFVSDWAPQAPRLARGAQMS